jgi:hypothetical protein
MQHPEDFSRIPEDVVPDVLSELVRIGRDPTRGKALWYQPMMGGDLTGCRSSVVRGGWRVVYRLRSDGVEVVAVGYRGLQGAWRGVYVEAVERTGGVPRTGRKTLPVRHHNPRFTKHLSS